MVFSYGTSVVLAYRTAVRVGKALRLYRKLFVAGGLFLLVLGAGAALAIWSERPLPPQSKFLSEFESWSDELRRAEDGGPWFKRQPVTYQGVSKVRSTSGYTLALSAKRQTRFDWVTRVACAPEAAEPFVSAFRSRLKSLLSASGAQVAGEGPILSVSEEDVERVSLLERMGFLVKAESSPRLSARIEYARESSTMGTISVHLWKRRESASEDGTPDGVETFAVVALISESVEE